MSYPTIFFNKKVIYALITIMIMTLVPFDLIQARGGGGGGHGGGAHGGGGGIRHGGGGHAAAHRSGGHHAAAHHNDGHHNNGHHNYNHNGNRGWRGGYNRNGYGWGYWDGDLWIALTAAQIAVLAADGGYSEETTYEDYDYDDTPEDAFVDVY